MLGQFSLDVLQSTDTISRSPLMVIESEMKSKTKNIETNHEIKKDILYRIPDGAPRAPSTNVKKILIDVHINI